MEKKNTRNWTPNFVIRNYHCPLGAVRQHPLPEFPLCLSGLRTQLVSMRTWVQSLALLSVLKIQHCCELWCRSQMLLRSHFAVAVALASRSSFNSTPSLGTSTCYRCHPKKAKKKKKHPPLVKEEKKPSINSSSLPDSVLNFLYYLVFYSE